MDDRRAFYDSRAELRLRETDRAYQRLLRKHYAFLVPPGGRLLELGCSLGDLMAAPKPLPAPGRDFSPKTVELARPRHPHLEFRPGDAAAFPAAQQFYHLP